MSLRLHRQGRFRRWLGARLGGDEALGDRAWRRIIHALGAAALVYEIIPNRFFVIAPKEAVLLAVLAVVLVLEALRHAVGLELPTLRDYERKRIGSYVFYSVALVAALLLFPLPISAAVILGTAWVDPLAGELRRPERRRGLYPAVPGVAYYGLAVVGMAFLGHWPLVAAAALGLLATPIALAAERARWGRWIDDDLAMTLAPAVALYVVGILALGLPH